MGVLLSLGFHGIPCTDPGGGRCGLTKKKQQVGENKNKRLGTPPVPIKGRGSPTF